MTHFVVTYHCPTVPVEQNTRSVQPAIEVVSFCENTFVTNDNVNLTNWAFTLNQHSTTFYTRS